MSSRYTKYIVEARTKDGKLDMDNKTPFLITTEKKICDYYFSKNPEGDFATMEDIYQYYNDQGWYIREKTW
jgi:hypothetical protein